MPADIVKHHSPTNRSASTDICFCRRRRVLQHTVPVIIALTIQDTTPPVHKCTTLLRGMWSLLLLISLACCTKCLSFRVATNKYQLQPRSCSTWLLHAGSVTLDTSRASWSVEDDTAEIEWGSSIDKTKALAKQLEEKRVAEIMAKVKPMDDFRLSYDPQFKEWIARIGYKKSMPVVAASTNTPALSSTSSSSVPISLGSMWDKFVAQFQLPATK